MPITALTDIHPAATLTRAQPNGARAMALALDGVTWQEFTEHQPRFQITGGETMLLNEGASENANPNPRCIGAVLGEVGAGGALPDDWLISTTASGITTTVTGIGGVVDGIQVVRFRLSGTAAQSQHIIAFSPNQSSPEVVPGQSVGIAYFVRRVSGDLPLSQLRVAVIQRRADHSQIGQATFVATRSIPGTLTRLGVATFLTNDADLARAQHAIGFVLTVGQTYNDEFEVGLPTFERWPTGEAPRISTPVLPAPGQKGASTRGADVVTWPVPPAVSVAASFVSSASDGARDVLTLRDAANQNRVHASIGAGGAWRARAFIAGVEQTTITNIGRVAAEVRAACVLTVDGSNVPSVRTRGKAPAVFSALAAPITSAAIEGAWGALRYVSTQAGGTPIEIATIPPLYDNDPIRAVLAEGQSNADNRSVGTNVCSVLTTTPRYPETCLMPAGPSRPGTWFERVFEPQHLTHFEPFQDCAPVFVPNTGAYAGQSFLALGQSLGSLLWTLQELEQADGKPLRRRLYMALGLGGASIDEVRKGGTQRTSNAFDVFNVWEGRIWPAITRLNEVALEVYGVPLIVDAIIWLHGERDGLINLPTSTYQTHLLQVIGDNITDIPALTGQSSPPVFLTDFVPAQGTGVANPMVFVLEGVALDNAYNNTYGLGPKYWMKFAPNPVAAAHLAIDGVILHGERFARAIHGLLQTPRVPPTWTRITGWTRAGNVVTLTCDVPSPPLVLDNVTVPAQTHHGFVLTNAGGNSITSVTISGGTSIVVTLAAPPSAGTILEYAYSGPGNAGPGGQPAGAWGNIRSSRVISSSMLAGENIYDFLATWRANISGVNGPGTTDLLKNRIIDHILRGQAMTLPGSLHIGLLTAAPSGEGGEAVEVAGGSYARVSRVRGLTQWAGTQAPGSTTESTGTGGQTSNNAALTFPAPTAVWGTVTHVGIFDAATGGNLLIWLPLATPRHVKAGEEPIVFRAGELKVSIA